MMKSTKRLVTLAILGTLSTFGAVSCGGDDPETPKDSDNNISSDLGSDSTVDSTGTSDNGTDTGTDTGTEAEFEFDTATQLGYSVMPPVGSGWMGGDDTDTENANPFKMQGPWYSYGCDFATVEPLGEVVRTEGKGTDGMCFKGSSPVVIEGTDTDTELDWNEMWGAGIGFNVCSVPDEKETDSDTDGTKYAMMSCPYNEYMWDATKGGVVGVEVDITGTFTPFTKDKNYLRIMFNEGDNVSNAYVEAANIPGRTTALFSKAKVWYNPPLKPEGTVPSAIQAIQFQVSAEDKGPISWDLCIKDVRILTAADVPPEDTDSAVDTDTAAAN
jgi:hypothetical protein